jgi:peroxiredoxin
MSDLTAGQNAPDFELTATDGSRFSLAEARTASIPVFASFFKVSCPTCQYALPFLERIYNAYPKDKVRLVGISQNDASETAAFVRQFGITFPILLDPVKSYPASNAYRLQTVPSTFAISTDGKIEQATIGWIRSEIEDLNRRVATASGVPPVAIFKPGESVAEFKAG